MEASKACTSQEKKRETKTVIKSQSRLLVNLLHNYFSKENENMGPLKSVKKVIERVADALQISKSSIMRILKEPKAGKIVTPGKRRPRKSIKTDLDSFDETAIRNHIYQYYEKKEWPTRIELVKSLNTAGLFHGKEFSLSTVLNRLNFKYKTLNRRKLLLERREIVTSRCLFFRKIQECDLDKVIFVGETWVNARHCISKCWNDDFLKSSSKIPTRNRGRLILAHAGSAQGFVQDCCLLFQSQRTEDYHQCMTTAVFKQWFESLLDKLPSNSVIVMDNAPYHSVLKGNSPITVWTKQEIQNWLTKNNVEWSTSMLKGELMDLFFLNKPKTKTYELDELAKYKECRVIRIPSNHGHFNPIEIIWAQVKGYVAHKNTTFQLSDVENLTKIAIQSITGEDWKRCVQYTAKIIDEASKKEGLLEKMVEQMIIQVHESSPSSKTDPDTDSGESSDEDGWDP